MLKCLLQQWLLNLSIFNTYTTMVFQPFALKYLFNQLLFMFSFLGKYLFSISVAADILSTHSCYMAFQNFGTVVIHIQITHVSNLLIFLPNESTNLALIPIVSKEERLCKQMKMFQCHHFTILHVGPLWAQTLHMVLNFQMPVP